MFKAPQKLKFKKFHKIKLKYSASDQRFFCPKFGDYGLQSLSFGRLTANQIEAGRRVITRFSKKKVFLKINIFPFLGITKKPTSARMGKGKGKVVKWVMPVKKGRILYEISSLIHSFDNSRAFHAFRLVNRKLPIKSKPVRLIY